MVWHSPASLNEAKVDLDEVTVDMSSRCQRRSEIQLNLFVYPKPKNRIQPLCGDILVKTECKINSDAYNEICIKPVLRAQYNVGGYRFSNLKPFNSLPRN